MFWDYKIFQVNGPNWNFRILGAWRVCEKNKMVFGCYDNNSQELASSLINLEIIDIEIQPDSLRIDPFFVLSNGKRLDFFSMSKHDPWILCINELKFLRAEENENTVDFKADSFNPIIEKMIIKIKPYLPLKISEVMWDETVFNINGPKWGFSTLSAWRVYEKNKMFFGCYDKNFAKLINFFNGMKIIDISVQTNILKIDPVFILSNGQKLEIFSTDTDEPWILDVEGLCFFAATPAEPDAFCSNLN